MLFLPSATMCDIEHALVIHRACSVSHNVTVLSRTITYGVSRACARSPYVIALTRAPCTRGDHFLPLRGGRLSFFPGRGGGVCLLGEGTRIFCGAQKREDFSPVFLMQECDATVDGHGVLDNKA